MKKSCYSFSRFRFVLIGMILLIILALVSARLFYLASFQKSFLQSKAKFQSVHTRIIPATRGIIFDRNGVPLAVSAPIYNVVFDPKVLLKDPKAWEELARNPNLNLTYGEIERKLQSRPKSRFMYVLKNVIPAVADSVMDMGINGVFVEKKYRTYYPTGPVCAQLIGFTNSNNVGQSGVELVENHKLQATVGKELILKSAIGQVLRVLKVLKPAKNGKDVTLSIDSRIQFLAYDALKQQVDKVKAKSGSVVVLDPKTGEVLAAVSYPSYNPNDLKDRSGAKVRLRSVTDSFEPGSTMKVFTIATGLASGKYTPDTPMDTRPGWYYIAGHRIRDDANFGKIDVTHVLVKSSNVGASKIALSLPREDLYNMDTNLGFGSMPSFFFPATTPGYIPPLSRMGKFTFATLSFGYSISGSLLQLARAYGAVANDGKLLPISFLKLDEPPKAYKRVMPKKVASQMRTMLNKVTGLTGTGVLANIPGYEVGGKTGTTHKVGPHGYYKHKYYAMFAGIAPIDKPKLVITVLIDDPAKGRYSYFGGVSAAPVFAKIAASALRVLNIPPTNTKVNYKLFKRQAYFAKIIAQA